MTSVFEQPAAIVESDTPTGGQWSTWNYVSLWMTGFHSVPGYVFIIALFHGGFTASAVLVGTAIAAIVLTGVCCAGAVLAVRKRLIFPDLINDMFGATAANTAAALRGIVALAWYGIQTYLAAVMLASCITAITGLSEGSTSLLGLSPMQWTALAVLSALQIVILTRGNSVVRRLADFAGPIIWISLVCLLIWNQHHGRLIAVDTVIAGPLSGTQVLTVAALSIAFLGGPSVNYADFACNARSLRSVLTGTAVGVIGNAIALAVVAILLDAQLPNHSGEPFTALLSDLTPPTAVALTLVLATCNIGANVVLNYVSSVYDLKRLANGALGQRAATVIVGIAAMLTCPGLWYSKPAGVMTFVSIAGAAVGPLAGLLVAVAVASPPPTAPNRPMKHLFFYATSVGLSAEATAWLVGAWLNIDVTPFAWAVGALAAALTGLAYFQQRQHTDAAIPLSATTLRRRGI